jgi:hypothetical protein
MRRDVVGVEEGGAGLEGGGDAFPEGHGCGISDEMSRQEYERRDVKTEDVKTGSHRQKGVGQQQRQSVYDRSEGVKSSVPPRCRFSSLLCLVVAGSFTLSSWVNDACAVLMLLSDFVCFLLLPPPSGTERRGEEGEGGKKERSPAGRDSWGARV